MPDTLNPQKYFSCDAIADRMVSDSDLWCIIKRQLGAAGDDEGLSLYSKIVVPQLMERRFLKPLWKTIYDFKHFMEDQIKDVMIREDVIKKLGNHDVQEYRVYVAHEFRTWCDLSLGEVFVVPRSNYGGSN